MKYFERYYCRDKLFDIDIWYNKINKQVKNFIKTVDIFFFCLNDGIDITDLNQLCLFIGLKDIINNRNNIVVFRLAKI